MATKSAADRNNKDIIDFDNIFHPLTKLDSRLFKQEQRIFRENVQPVLINDAVYIQGYDSNRIAVIWKYSLSRKSWSPLITPLQDQKIPNYTLTEYQSQLLLIGTEYNQKDQMLIIMSKYDEDKGWLPVEDVTTPPINSLQFASEFSAVSEGGHFVISWVEDEQFLLLVFDGLNWKEVKGPKCRNVYGRPNLIVHDGILYLSDCIHASIYSVPLELLLGGDNNKWKSLPDLPYKTMVFEGAANLALLNSSILATLIPSYTTGKCLVFALEPFTKSWIDLGEISCGLGHRASPRLVGLPPGSAGNIKLIAMGQIARDEPRDPIGGQVLIPFTALQHHFAVLEISATVTKYDPSENISLRALMIFEKCSSYKVLKELEKSQRKKETFMEKARFDISNKRTQIELYSDVMSAAHCIESWLSSTAQYTLPPTWNNFLHIILPEIKLSDIAEGIEKYLSSTIEHNVDEHDFDEIEQKHLAAIQQAINRQGSLSHTTIHGVIVGLARSGKDCLMKRLLGEMPTHKSPSTGVAEQAFHVSIEKCPSSTVSACVEDSRWIRLAMYDDETIEMMTQITSTQQNVKEAPRPSQQSEIGETIEKCSEEVASNSEDMNVLQSVVPSIQENTESDDIEQIPRPHRELPSHESPLEIFKTALRSKGLQGLREHLKSHWSIYLSNTGGQVEFQELLPLLVSGPSMFFVTFRLDQDLNVRYQIEYETAVETGDDSPPKIFKYTSSSTPLETILQTLASIDAVGTYDYSHKCRKKCALKYKVFIIGTHRDVLEARIGNEEGVQLEIRKIDKTIHESVKLASYYRCIEFATMDQLIFTVNNFSNSDDDFNQIRSSVQRNIDAGAFVTTSPSHWLIYSLVLRQLNNQIEHYSTCFKIAKDCGITDHEEHREALHFIHTKMGIIRYFQLDGLNSMVILNPQILFERVTKVITETFTFEQVGYHSTEDFKKGIFCFSDFERITRQKYPDSPLTPALFGDLLEHLHIAARFRVSGILKYFLPSALSHARDSALQKHSSQDNPSTIPPLVISFQCGYRPFGIAGALIAYLMNEGQNAKEMVQEWILLPEEIYRDEISFCVEPSCDTIVLKTFPTHLEVKCLPESVEDRDDYPVQKTCTKVCRSIKAGIEKVNSDINYINNAEPIFTFYCQCANYDSKAHPARIVYSHDNVPRRLRCPQTMETHRLPAGYENWQLQRLITCERTDDTCTHLLSNRHIQPDIALPDAKCMSLKYDTRCDKAHHAILYSQLKVHAAKWRNIGTDLGFSQGELDNIENAPIAMNLTGTPQRCLSAMLTEWLEWAPGDARGSTQYATFESLKGAVSEAGLGSIADSLKFEEKPFALKTELKEEAVAMTKAEPTSDKAVAMASWDLPGVEVCGEMSVVVHSSRYQPITWEGFGLRLHIQEDSLPAGMEQCTLNIKASLAGQYEFPENSSLVSAVFWLRCEPTCKFTKPVTIEIQHCAKSENVDNLKMKFVRALCSQTQLPYTFKELGGYFNRHSSYGMIQINGFSGLAVTQEGSDEREYCSQLFYFGQPNKCKIDFVVTWNIKAHLTVVKEEYERKGAILDFNRLVEFESDAITLDIPEDGITIEGWEVTPKFLPMVTKKQVDNFNEEKSIPYCQLLAEMKKFTSIKHRITLKGSKQRGDYILINLPQGESSSFMRSQTFGAAVTGLGSTPNKKSRLENDHLATAGLSQPAAGSSQQAVVVLPPTHGYFPPQFSVANPTLQQDSDKDEQRHLAAVQQAIDRQGELTHTTVHGVIVGLARSGKDSLMKRLLGEMPTGKSPSTGVAENAIIIRVEKCLSSTISACVEESRWVRLTMYDDEAIQMMTELSSKQRSTKDTTKQPHRKDSSKSSAKSVTSESFEDYRFHPKEFVRTFIQKNEENCEAVPEPQGELFLHKSPIEIFKTALQSKGLQGLREHLKSHWSIYLSNTGGQMEFQELLPLLVSGPSMFFVTFRLDRDLNQRYQIEYEVAVDTSDDSTVKIFKYTSSATPLETILQTLASIDAVGTYDYSSKHRAKRALTYKVFIIGTHKDVLEASIGDEQAVQLKIQEINKAIHESVELASYFRHIKFATMNQLIFTVDNFSKSDDDFNLIRSSVQQCVETGDFVTTSPSHWLIYSLVLRQLNSKVESYSNCFKIAKECGISDDKEHKEALHFIHNKMGIIRYFEMDGLNSMVILNPHVLFERVTQAITETFTFEQVGYHSAKEFKKGIFCFSEFERIACQMNPNSLLTAALFGKLLEHLHIAARFYQGGVLKYFFPCALSHTCGSDIQEQISQASSVPIPPLVISFQCGYRPMGIAGALIAYLMNEGQTKELEWILLPEKIYRDQISFSVEPSCDTIVLKTFPTHMEVRCLPESDDDRDDYPVQKTCTEVCRSIKAGIEKVNSDINYINNAEPIFTFYCQNATCDSKAHPAKIVYSHDNVPRRLRCPRTKKPHKLPTGYENWKLQELFTSSTADGKSIRLPSVSSVKPITATAPSYPNLTRCDSMNHAILLTQLNIHAAKWRDIGTHLGFLQGEMDNIQSSPMNLTGAPQSYLSTMLATWLEWAPGDARGSTQYATLEALKRAVSEAGLGSTADSLNLTTPCH